MNPFKVFDYIYSRFVIVGDVIGYKAAHEEIGILFLSFFQTLNIQTIINLLDFNDVYWDKLPILKFFGIIFLLFGLNYYRYTKVTRFRELLRKWISDSERVRFIKNLFVFIYSLLSFVFVIIS